MDVAEKAWAQITDGPIIGSGPYAMRHFLVRFGDDEQDHGAHNIYLSIWGEAGVPMLGLYLAVLWIGARRAFKAPIPAFDKGLLLLMWCDYFLIGFTWHGQLGDFNGLIFSCLLFVLPATLTTSSEADR
jgi:O-antigen ligase